MIVAVDGPAGAGKSTVARAAADALGFTYLDSGAMYRAVALDVMENDGAASERAGLIDKAVELLKKSIELDPGSAAQAYNYLGYMWVEKGEKLDEAGDLIQRALDMEPDNPAYMDSLGWWFYKKGDAEKALEHLQKAAGSIKPEDAVVYEHLGDVYGKLNNVAQALVYWQKAATLDPDDKEELAQKIENAKQKVTAHPAPGTQAEPH